MNKKNYYFYIIASFALLTVAPGRFAFGLVLVIELNFLLLIGLLFRQLLKIIDIESLNSAMTLIATILSTVLFKQLLILISPLTALQLSFTLYLVPLSAILLGSLFLPKVDTLSNEIKSRFSVSGIFSIISLAFFLIRDILGYGTFTLPTSNGLFENIIIEGNIFESFTFFASTPGAIILFAVIYTIYFSIQNKKKDKNKDKPEVENVAE